MLLSNSVLRNFKIEISDIYRHVKKGELNAE